MTRGGGSFHYRRVYEVLPALEEEKVPMILIA